MICQTIERAISRFILKGSLTLCFFNANIIDLNVCLVGDGVFGITGNNNKEVKPDFHAWQRINGQAQIVYDVFS